VLSRILPDECTTVSIRCKRKDGHVNPEIEEADDCPQRPGIMNVQTEATATIKSARFPSPFPPKQDECWMRTPTCGHFVKLEFVEFNVLGKDAFVTIDPPVNGQTIFRGNSFNSAKAPPKTVEFPHDHPVKVCFYSGSVVNGHKGFQAELTERKNNNYVTSPNYPEDISDATYLDPPAGGYSPGIHHCTVRSPQPGRALEMEFYQFDLNAPPESDGDWVTINPNPTRREQYYGVSLNIKEAPPKHHVFQPDEIASICFRTRARVDTHNGYVAEIYQEMAPSTMETLFTDYITTPTADYNYYDWFTDCWFTGSYTGYY